MNFVPRVEPIDNWVKNSDQLLSSLSDGSVCLIEQNQETAIVTSPNDWQQLLEHIQTLEAVIGMVQAEQQGEIDEFSPTELEEWATEHSTN